MAIHLYDLCGADPDLRFSPHCWKAKLALAHKGLAFSTIATPFTAITRIGDGDFTHTVPVIDHDGRLIRDSFAIALYLDEASPARPLFGPGGVEFARFVEGTVQATVFPIISAMILADIHAVLAPPDQEFFRRTREKRLGRRLEEIQEGIEALSGKFQRAHSPLRRVLENTPWLGGDQPMFVDYVAASGLIWLSVISGRVPLRDDDPVRLWFGRILDLHDGLVRKTPKTSPTA